MKLYLGKKTNIFCLESSFVIYVTLIVWFWFDWKALLLSLTLTWNVTVKNNQRWPCTDLRTKARRHTGDIRTTGRETYGDSKELPLLHFHKWWGFLLLCNGDIHLPKMFLLAFFTLSLDANHTNTMCMLQDLKFWNWYIFSSAFFAFLTLTGDSYGRFFAQNFGNFSNARWLFHAMWDLRELILNPLKVRLNRISRKLWKTQNSSLGGGNFWQPSRLIKI